MMKPLVILFVVAACTATTSSPADAPVDIPAATLQPVAVPPAVIPLASAPECPAIDPPPCVVEVVSFAEPAQVGYRACCAPLLFTVTALAVDSSVGPWGDVTTWSICGWPYIVEVTHPERGGTLPWAVLDVYDGKGGPISECRSVGAP